MNLKELMDMMNYNSKYRKGTNTSQLGSIQASILRIAQSLPTMNGQKWANLIDSAITTSDAMGPGYDLRETTSFLEHANPIFQETTKTR